MAAPDSADWINHSMMEVALKSHLSCPTVRVESIVVEPANKVGAGYGSLMSRVKVTYRKGEGEVAQQLPLIVKANLSAANQEEQVGKLTHVSSPARDLVYFVYANAGMEAHERLPSLLETYHSQLQASLRALGMAAEADSYPLDELLKDMDDLKHYALFSSAYFGFMLSSERIGDKFSRAIRDLNFQPDTLYGIYDNEYSRPYMQYIIRHFHSRGLL